MLGQEIWFGFWVIQDLNLVILLGPLKLRLFYDYISTKDFLIFV